MRRKPVMSIIIVVTILLSLGIVSAQENFPKPIIPVPIIEPQPWVFRGFNQWFVPDHIKPISDGICRLRALNVVGGGGSPQFADHDIDSAHLGWLPEGEERRIIGLWQSPYQSGVRWVQGSFGNWYLNGHVDILDCPPSYYGN